MSTDYQLRTCIDYCPIDNGEEDMCIGMTKKCYRKDNPNGAEDSPQNRVQDILQKIIKAQEQKKETVVL